VAAPGPSEAPVDSPSVVILADDVIWATRLWKSVQAAGGLPKGARRVDVLEGLIEAGARLAIVDLTARGYEPVDAVAAAVAAGARVLAVGQHDDVELRKLAIAAGAERVYAYRKLFEDGPAVLAGWLAVPAPSGSRR
jgi:hypothetical protein